VRGLNAMRDLAGVRLAARFDLGRDQTNLIHPRGVRDVDHVGHVGEGDGVIAFSARVL